MKELPREFRFLVVAMKEMQKLAFDIKNLIHDKDSIIHRKAANEFIQLDKDYEKYFKQFEALKYLENLQSDDFLSRHYLHVLRLPHDEKRFEGFTEQ